MAKAKATATVKAQPRYINKALHELIVPIDSVHLDEDNPQKHGEASIVDITNSLKEFGQRKPIVINQKTNIVIAGNGVLEAARGLGWEYIAASFQTFKNKQHERAFAIVDNLAPRNAEWDVTHLAPVLTDADMLSNEQFGAMLDELRKELKIVTAHQRSDIEDEPQDRDDIAEKLQAKWKTRAGQLWTIVGEAGTIHRLMCGDCRDSESVRELMDGKRAILMNTDPPYGVFYNNSERPNPGVEKPRVEKPRVENDNLCDEKLQEFLEDAFKTAVSHALEKNAAWYLWHADLTQGYFAAAAAAAAVVLHRQIIWVKPVLLLGRGQYHWKHEPCFMGWVKGNQPPDYGSGNGERNQTTVWEIGSVSQSERKTLGHSTPKPVGLFTIPIVKHMKRGEVCYDPFTGTGPQILAADQHGVHCYAMEIDPKYVAVILDRCTRAGMTCKLIK